MESIYKVYKLKIKVKNQMLLNYIHIAHIFVFVIIDIRLLDFFMRTTGRVLLYFENSIVISF